MVLMDFKKMMSELLNTPTRIIEEEVKEKIDMPCFTAATPNANLFEIEMPTVTFNLGAYRIPEVKNFIVNGNSCVIVWEDGKRTVVHCGEGETFDRYTGFMACVCKRLFGGTGNAKSLMNAKDPDYQNAIKEAEELRAKEEAEEEAKAKAAKVQRLRAKAQAKAREKEIQAMVEHMLVEEEALRRVEKILEDRAAAKKEQE